MELDHKLRVLALIAEKLNSARVVYAVGASAMLCLRGVVDTFQDVDLLVAEPDAARAAAVLRSLGTMAPQERHSDYPTHIFQEYEIDGVEVDLIAGMVIVSDDGETHDCPLLPEDIDAAADVRGVSVPLHSLACWQRCYAWMGRREKAELVEKAMRERERHMEAYRHTVQYYETDKMGITHHSNYIRWMEEARVDFLRQLGWGYERLEAMGIGSPVTALNCAFKEKTTFPDIVTVRVFVDELKNATLRIGYVMTAQDGKRVFEGTSEHCFLDRDGRIVRLRRALPDFYEALAQQAVACADCK